jgi:hypothetical protein
MRVFISYSHDDGEFANRLADDLRFYNFEVWIDQHGIQGGDAWRKAIVEGIDSSEAFLIILSPTAMASRNVAKELNIADERGKRIFPVVCKPCEIPQEMEYQLTGLQWIDFSADYDAAMPKLLTALDNSLRPASAPPKAQPVPAAPPSPQQNPALQPAPQPAAMHWLVGTWQFQFQNPLNGNSGFGQITYNPDGTFANQQTTPMGVFQASGRWWMANPQVIMTQGTYVMAAAPYMPMPFNLVVEIVSTSPTGFACVSQGGDQIVMQKVG